jgi:hypothetical protein
MRAGEPQMLAQELDKQSARIDFSCDGLTVHGHRNGDRLGSLLGCHGGFLLEKFRSNGAIRRQI